ncbi:copper-binding protein [Massilia sp. YMA4]|uniref:Copper-binding protein n=1 Tax=[Empedobacter] haloabium TaxID=592317 RepID=A0ABZ1URY5_9BURK|nr:copper-binding protein [Massilia sp. YMA4]AXA91364.1 RND transporter [Massilia sp. YMA4]
MKQLNNVILAAGVALSAVAFSPAYAQHDNHAQHAQHGEHAAASVELTDGEIKKVDKDGGKLTIKHGELKNLGMAAMTMVFRVQDAAMLDKVKVGDKVRFAADKVNGSTTVTHLEPAK